MAVSVYTGAGGGVASFNGRKGNVVPANGDYTKAQVGLSNVDNTSDANKPISKATQAALNDKQSKITANGILKGDGSGNITAASETEVELVSLPNICNPNLLDNWYFGNPVNQRGQTSYAGTNTYTIDRWMTDDTVTVIDGGVKVKQNGYYAVFYQYLEDSLVNAIAGKVVTYSALTTDGLMTATTQLPPSISSDWNTDDAVQGNFTLDTVISGAGKIYIRFGSGVDGAETIIKAVKLELGSQQTLAHQENGVWVLNEIPDYGEQLRKCQRYCVAFNKYDSFFPVDNNDFVVELPGPMRATQTIINPQNIVNANVTNPTVAWYNIGSNQLRLRSTASHGGLHAFCNGLVLFSADL